MPFVRYSRDKRGYEQIWLVHAPARRGRPSRARVLYWYRSPPGVRVGREPFDAALRARLEAQYPDIRFEWDQLAAAAVIPPFEIEPWRERRRAQREARRTRSAGEDDDAADQTLAVSGQAGEAPVSDVPFEDEERTESAGSSAPGDQPPLAEAPDAHTAAGQRRRRSRRRRPRAPESVSPGLAQGDSPPEPPEDRGSEDPTDRPSPSSDS